MSFVNDLIQVGKDLFLSGMVNSHSGNLSVRIGGKILITKSGTMLGNLKYSDFTEVGVFENRIDNASIETKVHRSIYKNTDAKAVVHCHPPFCIILSNLLDVFIPDDAEGKFYFDSVPILSTENPISSDEVAQKIPGLLKVSPVVIVKSHGIFSIGKNIFEAYKFSSSVESSAKLYYFKKIYQKLYKIV